MKAPSVGRLATIVANLCRVGLGAFWIHEGVFKYQAGFGRADILLVTSSVAQNSRVPGFYKFFSAHVLENAPGLFGFLVPLLEVGLGVTLVLGIFTLPIALASVFQLCNYWLADQLITQYPIMMALSAIVAACAPAARQYSLTTLALRRRTRAIPAVLVPLL
ncbi:MAG: DoxX family membrane protein [Marmoricola sp.]